MQEALWCQRTSCIAGKRVETSPWLAVTAMHRLHAWVALIGSMVHFPPEFWAIKANTAYLSQPRLRKYHMGTSALAIIRPMAQA